MARFPMSLWYKQLDSLFYTHGLDHFQSRFCPRYANRNNCVTPKTSVGAMVSWLVATGGIKPHVGNHFRNRWKQRHSYQLPVTSQTGITAPASMLAASAQQSCNAARAVSLDSGPGDCFP